MKLHYKKKMSNSPIPLKSTYPVHYINMLYYRVLSHLLYIQYIVSGQKIVLSVSGLQTDPDLLLPILNYFF